MFDRLLPGFVATLALTAALGATASAALADPSQRTCVVDAFWNVRDTQAQVTYLHPVCAGAAEQSTPSVVPSTQLDGSGWSTTYTFTDLDPLAVTCGRGVLSGAGIEGVVAGNPGTSGTITLGFAGSGGSPTVVEHDTLSFSPCSPLWAPSAWGWTASGVAVITSRS